MKIKLLFIISLIGILISNVKAQDYGLDWAKSFGATNSYNSVGLSITTDKAGNVYSTGVYEGTVDFDPGVGVTNLTTNGDGDIFIQKLDSLGNLLWVKSIGGSNGDRSCKIISDSLSNIYIVGYFQNTVDFDPGSGINNLSSNGGTDFFILKLDGFGDLVWAKSIGGIGNEVANSITIDLVGNVYLTGHFSNTVDFDPGSGVSYFTSNGNFDIFVQKLDPSGNLIWTKSMGGSDVDFGYSIVTDRVGCVYLTGCFTETVDFDPGNGISNFVSNGGRDIFVQKFDSLGNFLWAKAIGGPEWEYGMSIITGYEVGDLYITGCFSDTVDFDPGNSIYNLSSSGYYDIFIQKLDSSGNFIWAKAIGGTSWDAGCAITSDLIGNIYIIGHFSDTVDFDTGSGSAKLISNGLQDIFVEKLDASGNFIWVKGIGGPGGHDYGNYLTINNANDIYITGSFQNTVDFDPNIGINNLTAIGFRDIYVAKLKVIQTSITEINNSKLTIYPNPTSGKVNLELGSKYKDIQLILRNSEGKLLKQEEFKNKQNISLEIEGSKGIYLLEVISEDGERAVIRIIKQ
ncbi:MAG: T9SS type A sorting domain-containing protein [Saprospiraceae bacterium]|nr:T9SS type A sorting domain-containing protein [Saprospiraceae bacterium]